MDKILDFLKDAGVFFYASVDGDKARVRPFGFYMEYEGKLYFGMGKHKQSFKQTVENPNVEICALNKNNEWIRIRGTAVLDDRQEVMDKVFEVNPGLKFLYNEQTGNVLGNFYFSDGHAEIADMSGKFEAIDF